VVFNKERRKKQEIEIKERERKERVIRNLSFRKKLKNWRRVRFVVLSRIELKKYSNILKSKRATHKKGFTLIVLEVPVPGGIYEI
jgi:hypothetical protein